MDATGSLRATEPVPIDIQGFTPLNSLRRDDLRLIRDMAAGLDTLTQLTQNQAVDQFSAWNSEILRDRFSASEDMVVSSGRTKLGAEMIQGSSRSFPFLVVRQTFHVWLVSIDLTGLRAAIQNKSIDLKGDSDSIRTIAGWIFAANTNFESSMSDIGDDPIYAEPFCSQSTSWQESLAAVRGSKDSLTFYALKVSAGSPTVRTFRFDDNTRWYSLFAE